MGDLVEFPIKNVQPIEAVLSSEDQREMIFDLHKAMVLEALAEFKMAAQDLGLAWRKLLELETDIDPELHNLSEAYPFDQDYHDALRSIDHWVWESAMELDLISLSEPSEA